ncbi:receptor-binding cancer antigen expressed on SiSo cells-like isoform X2 [Dreissena polymorpha]|uniref:receptor-binding cancer antigen expressed on SiSo cells-like isoform X2 n=1 Tax=Dreissena polymorpha TaxID=45954 RepID=UPI0022647863|nr:receptor-binding cancer antigen expressed on SiSo cells-like isoform X2 [Dreissena polymorpha]
MMFKVIWNIIKKIFGVLFLLCTPLKRLWCRRKRRTSDTILPLANHYPLVENLNSNYSPLNGNPGPDLAPWDSWEEQQKVRSVEEYRQRQLLQQQNSQEPEPEPDYFQDMTPKYQKQKKVLIKKKEASYSGSISSKLAVAEDLPVMQTSELGSWEDEQGNAWEEEAVDDSDLAWEADVLVREKKRQERHLQQQRRKQERDQQRHAKPQSHLSAVKLS